ncbi:MAG TPA: MOSC domain-containing protein [bacterium]
MAKGAKGTVQSIHTTSDAGQPMRELPSVRALKGEGLEGDRYLFRRGTYSKTHAPDREVTLIETETLAWLQREHGIALPPAEARRNLVTAGVALCELIGKRFRVGSEVVLEGVRPCEPCGYLEKLTGKPVFAPLKDRGGLRTFIVQGGTLRVGDAITELAEAEAAAPIPTPPSRG